MLRTASGLSSSSAKANYSGLDEHLLPLFDPTQAAGQTLQSLGEDLDLIAKAEARTAGFRRTLPLAGNDSERTMWLAAAAAASTSAIMSQSPTRLTFHQVLSTLPQRLAEQYSLGPLPVRVAMGQAAEKRRAILDIKARAAACRNNAEMASKILGGSSSNAKPALPYSVQQIWSLLAVSLDLFAAAQENPDGLASEGGALLSWADGVLGCGLLRRIVLFLAGYHDVQLLATCVCVLGGPQMTIELMKPQQQQQQQQQQQIIVSSAAVPSSEQLVTLRQLLDRSMACYADILSRWGALTKAAEVSKHDTVYSQHLIAAGKGGATDRCIGLGVTCSRCRATASVITTNNPLAPFAHWCSDCRDFAVCCAICMASVRSTAFFCASCGHGGHPDHVKTWFEHSVECPTGCGCRCAELGVALSHRTRADQEAQDGSTESDTGTGGSSSGSDTGTGSSSESDDGSSDEEDDEEDSQSSSPLFVA